MGLSEKIKSYLSKSREKHKLSFTNDHTYHEKWSFRVSSMNLVSLLLLYSLLLIAGLTLLIRFTPLGNLFVEKGGGPQIEQINDNRTKLDSLIKETESTQLYLDDLQKILSGEPFDDSLVEVDDSSFVNYQANFESSMEDSLLRLKVENIGEPKAEVQYDFFFAPVRGIISQSFFPKKSHFGVDIVTSKDEPIKSCLEGTIIYSSWTPNDGEIIIIQHSNAFISVYKHCSSTLKNIGDRVQTGDPIGIVGNSGKHTSGPHLHFEMWKSGIALNPQEFINFNK